MVKREMVVPNMVIQVSKAMPGSPGPKFHGKLGIHERLLILSKPRQEGGLNLVNVRREKTGEDFEVMYAFITNYCKLPSLKRSRAKKSVVTIVPSGE